jgi:hypothetical protein
MFVVPPSGGFTAFYRLMEFYFLIRTRGATLSTE